MKTLCRLAFVVLGLTALNIHAATLYVSLDSTNPIPPFASWETAATNIQQAVDVAKAGDTVLVTNGVYQAGGRGVSVLDVWLSRVVITNSIRLESVNGPPATTIAGGRTTTTNEDGTLVTIGCGCVYLGSNAVLSGFTLTNGISWLPGGGGVFCERFGVVTNCTLTGNYALAGGGAW